MDRFCMRILWGIKMVKLRYLLKKVVIYNMCYVVCCSGNLERNEDSDHVWWLISSLETSRCGVSAGATVAGAGPRLEKIAHGKCVQTIQSQIEQQATRRNVSMY